LTLKASVSKVVDLRFFHQTTSSGPFRGIFGLLTPRSRLPALRKVLNLSGDSHTRELGLTGDAYTWELGLAGDAYTWELGLAGDSYTWELGLASDA